MIINGYFGHASIWLALIAGWGVLAIISHIVFAIIARYDGRGDEGNTKLRQKRRPYEHNP